MSLVRPTSEIGWELRGSWAAGKRVAVSLDERCRPRRLEGKIQRVAPSGAFAVIEGFHVPMDAILAVHNPSRLGDSTIDEPPPVPRCIVCQREVEIDKRTEACAACAAELGVAA